MTSLTAGILYRAAIVAALFAVFIIFVVCFSVVSEGQASPPPIPIEVKQAAIVALKASSKDNLHEEAFKWGRDAAGNVLVSPSIPGAPCGTHVGLCESGFTPADPSIDEKFVTIEGFAHVHPYGTLEHQYVQPPSKVDIAVAASVPAGTINIVIAAADKKIYFYDGTGVIAVVKWKEFIK